MSIRQQQQPQLQNLKFEIISDDSHKDDMSRYRNAKNKRYLDIFKKYYVDITDELRIDEMNGFGTYLIQNPSALTDFFKWFYGIYLFGYDEFSDTILFEEHIKSTASKGNSILWLLDCSKPPEENYLSAPLFKFFEELTNDDKDYIYGVFEDIKKKSPFVFCNFSIIEFCEKCLNAIFVFLFQNYLSGASKFSESFIFSFIKDNLKDTGLEIDWTDNENNEYSTRGFYIKF